MKVLLKKYKVMNELNVSSSIIKSIILGIVLNYARRASVGVKCSVYKRGRAERVRAEQ